MTARKILYDWGKELNLIWVSFTFSQTQSAGYKASKKHIQTENSYHKRTWTIEKEKKRNGKPKNHLHVELDGGNFCYEEQKVKRTVQLNFQT